jgi:hypothetical protein
MAVAFVQEFEITDRSTVNYDYIKEGLGDGPFDGLIVHTAGFDEENGVFRILDVWESREQAERFNDEMIQPLVDQGPDSFPNPGALRPPTREAYYELYDVVR